MTETLAADDEATYARVRDFLFAESACLDEPRLDDWLDRLTDDVRYRVPVRATSMGTDEFFGPMFMDDNRYRLERRVQKLQSEYAWSVRPPSRIRHFITNIRVQPGEAADEVAARSNFQVLRTRGKDPDIDTLFGERRDVLREVSGELKLAERTVRLDQTTLPVDELSFFI